MYTSRVLLRGILVVCLWSCSVWPSFAQGVGAIGGTVTDSSGAVLPGATVTLSNAQGGTVGGQQDVTTDERGAYQFLRLVPGTYYVRGQISGFRTVELRNIGVNADNTSRADLLLPLGQLEEGVVVSGQAPLLDTTSALRQVSLSQEVLQSLPNRVDVWSITRAIPSITVSKVDVGGSESFQDSVATVRGTSNEGGILIDGMNVSSTTGFGITPAFYPIPWAYAETNFQAGNGPAESSRGGLLYNMISRTGTNQLHGGGAFNGTNHGLFFDNVSPDLRTQVLRNVPARVLAANPSLKPGADIRYFFDYGGWIAGPIVPDKVWFSTTFFHQQILQHNLGAYSADGTPVPDDSFIWNNSNKLAWQVMPSSQLSWFHTIQRKVQAHQPSLTQFQEAGATMYNGKTPQVHQLKWTSSLSSKMLFDASGSILRIHDFYEPPPEAPQDALIAGFDQVTNTLLRVLPSFRDANYRRMGFYTSLSYFTASHDIKGGYQFDYAQYLNTNYSTSGMRAVYRNGVPDSVNTYNTPNSFNMKDREVGLYIQDKWRPTRKLTVNIGLRYERNYGWMDAVCQDETPFVQARCYDALKGFPDFQDVNPRFSAIYDVRGDGRTALKFSANRYVVPIGISVVNRVNPNQLTSDTRPWTACAAAQVSGCDLNRDFLPQLNELGPSSGFTFGINNRYAEDYERPHAREYTVEIQRQLPGNVVLTTGYTRREKRGEIGSRNAAVPMSTYIPVTVTEVNSGRMVTVYNQDPVLAGTGGSVVG